MNRHIKILSFLFLFSCSFATRSQTIQVVVDQNGKGNFRTIEEAVASLPENAPNDRTIFIRNGVYQERIIVNKSHVVFQGEDQDKTILTGSIAHVIYTCEHAGDKNSATVNLYGDDITIKDLTIENTYGRDAVGTVWVNCAGSGNSIEKMEVAPSAHQFALRSFKSTRLKVIHCKILAWGADTVAPWNSESGMYYFKDCIMQGGTDFFCPRGWSYAENCTFICLNPSAAAIWHDGGHHQEMKSVLKDCKFIGATPYKLGRYHHDASFYLVNCSFDKNLLDLPVYKAATAQAVYWGSRAYFYNCHKAGGDFEWIKDNLETAQGIPPWK